jgi:hypothetical protein
LHSQDMNVLLRIHFRYILHSLIGVRGSGKSSKKQMILLVNSAGRFDSVSVNEFQENGK